MSGKCKSTPIKTNNLIYIMIFFQGGCKKISRGGKKKFGAQNYKYLPPPTESLYPPLVVDQTDRYTNKTHQPNIICPQIKSKAAKQKYISFMIQTITRMLVKTLPYRPVQFSSLTKPCYSTELGEHLNSSSALQLFIFLCTCPTLCAGSVSTLMGWLDFIRYLTYYRTI